MTPQEKADELVKKMYKVMSDSVSDITLYFSKQCALIAVDEILEDQMIQDGMRIEYPQYWLDVKREIEKLEWKK